MNNVLKIDGLYQQLSEPEDLFFRRIDQFGGWPVGYKYVTFVHSIENQRPCYFENKCRRDEMNTTICSADEYYWWKITELGKQQIKKQHINEFKTMILNM